LWLLVADAHDPDPSIGLGAVHRAAANVGARVRGIVTRLSAGGRIAVMGEGHVRVQTEAARTAGPIDALRLGHPGNGGSARALMELLADQDQPRVLDPSLVDRHGRRSADDETVDAVRAALCPTSTVLCANVQEAEWLTGRTIRTRGDARDASRRLSDTGARWTLVTGGRLQGHPVDFLYDGSGVVEFGADRIRRPAIRGLGPTFTTWIACGLALGRDVPEAVERARFIVLRALEASDGGQLEPLARAYEALGIDAAPIEDPSGGG
jgi:hydroxymethylpyrimidine/phosphomethylpyrimidine kinase